MYTDEQILELEAEEFSHSNFKLYKHISNRALDDFQEWLKTQVVGIDNTSKEVLVVVGDRWELAIEKYKEEKNNG